MPMQDQSTAASRDMAAAGKTVLVFGATGQQGGAVASALQARGWPVRALVRDPSSDKAAKLRARGVEIVAGDLADAGSIGAAMQGVYGVFSVQPSSGQGALYGISDEQEIAFGTSIADLALAHHVQHLVYTSASAAGSGPTGIGHFDSKTEIEAHIRSLDLRYSIIRPATFMELLMLPGMGLDQGCFTFFLRPDQAGQVIAVQNIGKIVAAIFADPGRFAGRTIEIAGDQMTGSELGETLGRAAGRKIAYQRFADALLAQNAFLGRLAALFDDGRLAGRADIPALTQEFGSLTSLEEWLAGPGAPLLKAAIGAKDASVSLR